MHMNTLTHATTDLETGLRTGEGSRLLLNKSVDPDELLDVRYAALVVARDLAHIWRSGWTTSARTLDGLGGAWLATAEWGRLHGVVLDLGGELDAECVASLTLRNGYLYAHAAAAQRETLSAAEAWLRERLPVAEPTEDEEVPVRFWTRGRGEGSAISRDLQVRDWLAIRDDYPQAVRGELDALMAYRPDAAAGQLLLWHGEPGTGKTTALRALAWEWRRWCHIHYITDPECFFGSSE